MKLFKSVLFVFFVCLSTLTKATGISVLYINPGHSEQNATGDFWANVNHFMEAAANDMGIDFTSLFADRNHIKMKALVKEVHNLKPDYVILTNEKGVADEMIKYLVKLDVPIFMLLNNFHKNQLSETERSLIIGSIEPNNFSVGERLATDLIETHRRKTNAPYMMFYALQGDFTTPASIAREAGLKSALRNYPDVHLIDSTYANWSQNQAYQKTQGISKRYDVDIIWAANDPMAFGAIKAISESRDRSLVTIGGINWDTDDENFPLDISYGGHVILGAKALSMIHDYHLDLVTPQEMHQVLDIFESGTPEQIAAFNQKIFEGTIEDIDFTRFSKSNPTPLEFNIGNLVSGIDETIAQRVSF